MKFIVECLWSLCVRERVVYPIWKLEESKKNYPSIIFRNNSLNEIVYEYTHEPIAETL